MSKTFQSFLLIFAAAVLILQLFNNSFGQSIDVTIDISEKTPSIANIELRWNSISPFPSESSLSFVEEYAGISGLSSRISGVAAKGKDDRPLKVTKAGPNTYSADDRAAWWSYQIDLKPRRETSAAAHISWLNGDGGILMPYDLLPKMTHPKIDGTVYFHKPAKWKLVAFDHLAGPGVYPVADLANTVFYLNTDIRWQEVAVASAITMQTFVALNISGQWHYTDAEAMGLVDEVFNRYNQLFELRAPRGGYYIYLGKFPSTVAPGNWEADTRGNSITILSSDMPFRSQSIQRLHEQLRHEIFHLWIPNGVNLSGNYDWFYEGFALYQSLKMGVAVNRIRFDDFLDTLSRAYNIDSASGQRMSLIVASGNRWNGANTQVYARGMLVAFLCDLALLNASKGKLSTNDLLRRFYADFSGPNPGVDGNTAIIGSFNRHNELRPVVNRYITGSEAIEWDALLGAVGLKAIRTGNVTNLAVKQKPSGRQKDLLDKLGYNSWRKLSDSNR